MITEPCERCSRAVFRLDADVTDGLLSRRGYLQRRLMGRQFVSGLNFDIHIAKKRTKKDILKS